MNKKNEPNLYRLSLIKTLNIHRSNISSWDYGRKHALPLWMEFVGFSRWKRDSLLQHICPNNTTVEMPLEGDMTITCQERKTTLRVGELMILPPGEDNQLEPGPSGHCWKLSCGLCGSLVEQHLSTLRLSVGNVLKIGEAEKYAGHLREIGRMLQLKDEYEAARIAGMTFEFLVQLSIRHAVHFDPIVANAIRIMEFNLSRNLKLDEIVNELGISREKLNRVFRAEMGMSPKHYLIELRLKNAECFLLNTQKNIKDIAFLTGYSSPQKFCNEFFRKHEMSPGDFRKKNPGIQEKNFRNSASRN